MVISELMMFSLLRGDANISDGKKMLERQDNKPGCTPPETESAPAVRPSAAVRLMARMTRLPSVDETPKLMCYNDR